MWLYFSLLGGSLFVPLVLSFDKKLQFYKQWKYLFPALFLVAVFYLIGDVIFTKNGIWGFNPAYHSDILIFQLPLEEILFFIVVPYCCIFLFDTFKAYFPRYRLPVKASKALSVFLFSGAVVICIVYYRQAYTLFVFLVLILSLVIAYFDKSDLMSRFYAVFLIIFVPFLLLNGILTGSITEEPVVWYNNSEIIGVRIKTIPLEDSAYAFTLIYLNLYLRERIMARWAPKS